MTLDVAKGESGKSVRAASSTVIRSDGMKSSVGSPQRAASFSILTTNTDDTDPLRVCPENVRTRVRLASFRRCLRMSRCIRWACIAVGYARVTTVQPLAKAGTVARNACRWQSAWKDGVRPPRRWVA